MIDKLLEIMYYILLLVVAWFVDYKIIPAISTVPKKDNFLLRNLKLAEFVVFLRLLYVICVFISDYFY